jgi:hypothetical protein
MATRSGDLRIMAVASHRQRQLSAGWRGPDSDEQQIDPLIVSAKDPDQAATRNPEPVHGNPSTVGEPDSARSAVPSGRVQPDPTDPGAPSSEFLTQRDELESWICRPWPPRPVQSTPGGTTRLQAQPYRAATGRRAEPIHLIWIDSANRRHIDVPVPA